MPESSDQNKLTRPGFFIRKTDNGKFGSIEKTIVFIVCYIIALSLWLLVNLGRDYVLSINMPLSMAQMSEELALADDPPKFASVSVLGEGWKLLNLYNNPPVIQLNPSSETLNLSDAVAQHMSFYQDINIQKVTPTMLNLKLEERITRQIPVKANITLDFRRQFDLVGEPQVEPSVVEISGARSRIEAIREWPTRPYKLSDVRDDIDVVLNLLEAPDIVDLATTSVRYNAQVSEYTEGEIRILIRTRNLPPDREVRFSPSVISIKYDVPLDQYAAAQDTIPYMAYVLYDEIRADTTGFISPVIAPTAERLNLKLRSYQPRRVSYYNVVRD